ncbi:ABC transporter ATP-binding protein/permease [Nostoc sp. FACHB-152]|uniref:ABC transporter ATP-binding protein/permease n=1 Tax=unclassified Nostoc TaxID=2593658 RepID=UPI0016843C0C|nr:MULTISPECIES: ABC transporter ATP-binding protein/permease [unclassified Nostoc]MBD2449398.1 ABC transporter ATP-binding protein/permease [Nostoc sp. FACHB-152]MBD2470687.1 ABC transporter ATP-binding protein/permease [Nostoc sp. FACHB-145]
MKNTKRKFLWKFWSIAKLYWAGEEKWGAIGLLLILITINLVTTQVDVIVNSQNGSLLSALAAKNANQFWNITISLLGLSLFLVLSWATYNYVRKKLTLYWRRWLTNHFLDNYFKNRAFYELSQAQKELDNPDQRISQDINSFADGFLSLFFDLLHSTIQIIAFSAVLWIISPTLMISLVIYAVSGTLITTGIFGRKLVKIIFNQNKKEADFRFGLVRLRENAESVAFYRGEAQEARQVKFLFNRAFKNFNDLLLWQELYLNCFIRIYQFIPRLLPAVIIAPQILSGELEIGKFGEAQGAFFTLFNSMFVISRTFNELAGFAASIERLYELDNFYKQLKPGIYQEKLQYATIETVEENRLAIQNLTLYTPNYQRILCTDVSVNLQPREGLLIIGTSGCGKSSLLRAIAGLWNSGDGTIIRPKLDEILFLPQRPYMVLGSLRNQLIYPHVDIDISDEELQQILKQINLPDLAERFGGFDVEKDWSDVLSLGEQQRVAFARILINQPQYVILDEATSALDVKNEENLYRHLALKDITFISVGHRPTLFKYHHQVLELLDSENWELRAI